MTIGFFGSSKNSLTVLRTLNEAGFDIVLIVTAPPRPVGRKQVVTKSPPHQFAEKKEIPVLSPEKIDADFVIDFKKHLLEVCIVADYARLIPKEALDHPKHGCLNLHPSLLPRWRGSSPGEAAILHGDKATGVTIIKMDEQFDHGPIISQFEEEILDTDTSESLYQRLFSAGAKVVTTILPAWIEGRIIPREQDHTQASFAYRLDRDDGFLSWPLIQKAIQGLSLAPEERPGKWKMVYGKWPIVVERAIRAFHPWPGIWTNVPYKAGMKRLKILSAHLAGQQLILDNVQFEGKQPSRFDQIKTAIAAS